jgi:sugar O-acyltransferase (sialic acid O-acetyltransferase NeuD family)
VFWGATGQAKVLRELTSHLGYQLVAVFDNNPEVLSPFADVPLFHGREGFEEWWQSFGARSAAFLIAIGGASGRDRLRLQRSLEERGLTPITAVHPAAFVAADASIGQGSQILMRAIVGVAARLGAACIVNTAASVDHESRLGDGVHIAPGATLAGCVEVGDFSMIGTGAVLLPRIRVGRDVIVGAGAVVTRDLPDGVVAYGNPARIVRANCPQARC